MFFIVASLYFAEATVVETCEESYYYCTEEMIVVEEVEPNEK